MLAPKNDKIVEVKTRYIPEVHDVLAYQIMANTGATVEQLAKTMKVGKTTLDRWQGKNQSLRDAIRSGRDEFDSKYVEASLLKRALGYVAINEVCENVAVLNMKNTCGKLVIDADKCQFDEEGNLITGDWLGQSDSISADFNADGKVNNTDLSILAGEWLIGTD